jgi:hypothetical protein
MGGERERARVCVRERDGESVRDCKSVCAREGGGEKERGRGRT